MTVKVTFTGDKSEVNKQTAISAVDAILSAHETTSDTDGTYRAENNAIQPTRNATGFDVHVGLSLRDVDDSQYPDVKTDLAETIASLPLDFGTVDEIKDQINGNIV